MIAASRRCWGGEELDGRYSLQVFDDNVTDRVRPDLQNAQIFEYLDAFLEVSGPNSGLK
jgi:hypothetical protein